MSNPANHLPPEYDDIQPNDYDPAFTADISTQMRVPERIGAVNGNLHEDLRNLTRDDDMRRSASMNVPDKILLLGEDQHIGVREMPKLHLDFTADQAAKEYVGLSTPPRVITMEEEFPLIEDNAEEEFQEETPKHQPHLQNGYVTPVRRAVESLEYEAMQATPGTPLLIADEDMDEVTVMKRRMDKLALHVYHLEEENAKRSQREWVLYPLVMVYFLFKVGQWFGSK